MASFGFAMTACRPSFPAAQPLAAVARVMQSVASTFALFGKQQADKRAQSLGNSERFRIACHASGVPKGAQNWISNAREIARKYRAISTRVEKRAKVEVAIRCKCCTSSAMAVGLS